jgi:hypothetical protein
LSAEIGIFVALLLAMGALVLVARPLRAGAKASDDSGALMAYLLAHRENAYQALRDLDSDLAAGRLAEDDYRPMRVQALAQAAEIVARLDSATVDIQLADSKLPAVAEPLEKATTEAFCPNCGAERQPDDAFCRRCGQKLTSD